MKKNIIYGLLSIVFFTFNVNMVKADVAVEGITTTSEYINLFKDSQITPQYAIFPDNATNKNVTWRSSDEICATVNSSGVITPESNGGYCFVLITATTEDGNFSQSYNVKVYDKFIFDANGGTLDCLIKSSRSTAGDKPSLNSANSEFTYYKDGKISSLFGNNSSSDSHCDVTKEGKYFAGWYTDPVNGEYISYDSELVNLNLGKVYAHWLDTPIEITSIKINEDLTENPLKIVGIRSTNCTQNSDYNNQCLKNLSIKVEPEYAVLDGTIKWTSSNGNMVKLSDTTNPAIYVYNAQENISGESTVTVEYTGNNKSFTDSYLVRVYNDENSHTYFYPERATIKVGDEYSVRAYSIPISNLYIVPRSINFEISDETVAQDIGGIGYVIKVKGLKAGTTIINTETASKNFTLTVSEDFTYTVVYEGNGGTTESGSMSDQMGTFGEDLILKSNEYTKEKYIFGGWKAYIETYENGVATRTPIEENNKPKIYPDGATIKDLNIQNGNKLILVAQWIENPKTGLSLPVIAGMIVIITSICGYAISKKIPTIKKI